MCKVGAGCNRRICFFAHKPEELRPLPEHLANEEGPAGVRRQAVLGVSMSRQAVSLGQVWRLPQQQLSLVTLRGTA